MIGYIIAGIGFTLGAVLVFLADQVFSSKPLPFSVVKIGLVMVFIAGMVMYALE
jgi:hypothetical protein